MQTTLIDQGITLMLFGMGTVFVFLTVLVFATHLMSSLVNKFVPDDTASDSSISASSASPGTAPPTKTPTTHDASAVNPKLIRVIEKAVAAHRANQ